MTKEEILKPKLFSDQHDTIEQEWPGIHHAIYQAMDEYALSVAKKEAIEFGAWILKEEWYAENGFWYDAPFTG